MVNYVVKGGSYVSSSGKVYSSKKAYQSAQKSKKSSTTSSTKKSSHHHTSSHSDWERVGTSKFGTPIYKNKKTGERLATSNLKESLSSIAKRDARRKAAASKTKTIQQTIKNWEQLSPLAKKNVMKALAKKGMTLDKEGHMVKTGVKSVSQKILSDKYYDKTGMVIDEYGAVYKNIEDYNKVASIRGDTLLPYKQATSSTVSGVSTPPSPETSQTYGSYEDTMSFFAGLGGMTTEELQSKTPQSYKKVDTEIDITKIEPIADIDTPEHIYTTIQTHSTITTKQQNLDWSKLKIASPSEQFAKYNKAVAEKTTQKILPKPPKVSVYDWAAEKEISFLKSSKLGKTKIGKKLISAREKSMKFEKGATLGAYSYIRDKPLYVASDIAVGMATSGAGNLLKVSTLGTKAYKTIKTAEIIGGTALGGIYSVTKAYEFSKAKTPEEKGKVIGQMAVELGAFSAGAKIGNILTKPSASYELAQVSLTKRTVGEQVYDITKGKGKIKIKSFTLEKEIPVDMAVISKTSKIKGDLYFTKGKSGYEVMGKRGFLDFETLTKSSLSKQKSLTVIKSKKDTFISLSKSKFGKTKGLFVSETYKMKKGKLFYESTAGGTFESLKTPEKELILTKSLTYAQPSKKQIKEIPFFEKPEFEVTKQKPSKYGMRILKSLKKQKTYKETKPLMETTLLKSTKTTQKPTTTTKTTEFIIPTTQQKLYQESTSIMKTTLSKTTKEIILPKTKTFSLFKLPAKTTQKPTTTTKTISIIQPSINKLKKSKIIPEQKPREFKKPKQPQPIKIKIESTTGLITGTKQKPDTIQKPHQPIPIIEPTTDQEQDQETGIDEEFVNDYDYKPIGGFVPEFPPPPIQLPPPIPFMPSGGVGEFKWFKKKKPKQKKKYTPTTYAMLFGIKSKKKTKSKKLFSGLEMRGV